MTAVSPSAAGILTVYPDGASGSPTASNVNYTAGQVIPNRVTVSLPTSDCTATTPQLCGLINVYSSQATNVVIDISGYYTAPSGTPAGAAFIPESAPLDL